MQSPAARLLDLLSLLQSRPRWTAPELAGRLGVTERTVRRDVSRLRDLGYPVDAEPGPTGGYELGAGGALPPLLLTDDESVAVAVGLRTAASGGVVGHEEAAVAALAKLEQVLPAHLRERVLALNTVTVMARAHPAAAIDPSVLLTLAQGCRRAERVAFAYRDGSGQESERRVEPYGLVNLGRRWYLVAHDLDRVDWRTFRLDRMGEPRLTGHRFTRTSDPDVAAMVAEGLAVGGYRWQAELVVDRPIDEVRAEVAETVGSVEEHPRGALVHIGANELDWIAHFVASLPWDVEVRSPPELRAELRALGRRLQRAHRG